MICFKLQYIIRVDNTFLTKDEEHLRAKHLDGVLQGGVQRQVASP